MTGLSIAVAALAVLGVSLLAFRRGRPGTRSSASGRLVFENRLERVGWGGTRRNCYKVGDTGLCVKFYKPPEECVGRMKPSIRREIARRRFDKYRNSSSREVYLCHLMRRTMPKEVSGRLPEVCRRVFHPEWGWGILETYYTNPDGTAIIPYEFEIARRAPKVREEIYAQAEALLGALVESSARFYEPGNFHTQIGADGSVATKIVDFEPDSKSAVPLEAFWPWYRRRKLARKARRYLRHIRDKYGVRGKSLRWIAAERAFGVEFASFERVAAGNSSVNAKATTADGRSYFVKFSPSRLAESAMRRVASVVTPLVPRLAFGGASGELGASRFFATEWCPRGASVDPAEMSAAQCGAFVSAYAGLSRAMQSAVADLPRRDDLKAFDFGMEPVAIHGDLHFRNFFFDGDEVSAFFDLETMRVGYPTEDLLRVFVHALERTRFWRRGRIAAVERAFGEVVRRSGYPAKAWIAAVDLHMRRKGERRLRRSAFPAAKRFEAWLRAGLYRRLKDVASREARQ